MVLHDYSTHSTVRAVMLPLRCNIMLYSCWAIVMLLCCCHMLPYVVICCYATIALLHAMCRYRHVVLYSHYAFPRAIKLLLPHHVLPQAIILIYGNI